ncbi:hypothetical protein HDK77DRAFT_203920 [Phyllosticta capitalensis]|uniref:Uncharacterized protein n=1 Tax=Phyllosticta capitalensis TaxID=121624 RepID=A0ABR1YXD7_9PEZI
MDICDDNWVPPDMILSKRSDWAIWYTQIRLLAHGQGVWQYVDPDIREPNDPTEPKAPRYSDDANIVDGRDKDDVMHERMMDFEIEVDKWNREKKGISRVAFCICETVAREHCWLMMDEERWHPRQLLQDLRRWFVVCSCYDCLPATSQTRMNGPCLLKP